MSKTEKLSYPFAEKPSFGGLLEVSEGLFWLRVPIPFALDHINLWLLRDGDGWTIIDTGFFSAEVATIWERLLEEFCAGAPIKKIVVTHFHPDHVGMASWLVERTGAELWMSEREFLTVHRVCQPYSEREITVRTIFFERFGLNEKQLASVVNARSSDVEGLPEAPVSYRRLVGGQTLSINGENWNLFSFAGHSPEHICLHNAERNLLISGDQVLPSISPNISVTFYEPQANPLAEYLNSLSRLSELNEETLVLPSHGSVFQGLHRRIDQLEAGHQKQLDRLLEFCRQPRDGKEALEAMFGNRLSAFNLSLGVGEAQAHLNYLVAKRELKQNDEFIPHYQR